MKKPIRILHCFGRMDRGGAETMIMNIYRNIDRENIQFDFVVHTDDKCSYDDEILSLGGTIYRVPKYTVKNHLAYKKAWNQLFLENFNNWKMIHGHITSTGSIYFKIAREYGILTIAHSHSTASLNGYTLIKDIMQKSIKTTVDYLFACSEEAGEWLFGDYTKKSNYYVLNNAIDTDKFIFNADMRNNKRKVLGIEDKFVIGHIGSMYSPKNHSYIIDIFNEILNLNSNAILLLVGDGSLRISIEKKILELGMEQNVIMMGVRTDISDLLQAMDVFLLPSIHEGLPVTLVEAQASGLKCIVSDVITEEVKITDEVEFISLQKSPEYWAKEIIKYAKGYVRKDNFKKVFYSGYDIGANVTWLESFYLKK